MLGKEYAIMWSMFESWQKNFRTVSSWLSYYLLFFKKKYMWSFILMNNIKFKKNTWNSFEERWFHFWKKIVVSRLAEYDYVVIIRENKLSLNVNNILVCLFGGFRPTLKFFTRTEMSPLPVKGFKCSPILCTHGNWAVRVL